MIVSITNENTSGEHRVAVVPALVSRLTKAGFAVHVERKAGLNAGFPDDAYVEQGAEIVPQLSESTDVLLKVGPPASEDINRLKPESIVIGFLDPEVNDDMLQHLASRQITSFAMELIPRIARAQAMDALSAMSTVSGYKAVLLAANHLPRFFPLLMTAAGTIPAARVLVVGAGVSGLEAMGVARRLGAVVEGCDIRPEAKEEVESIGATFIAGDQLGGRVAASDVVIAAAFVRGKRAPVLITGEMVRSMRPGSVIVDLAASQGGNCAYTEADRDVVQHGVTIVGPSNLPSSMPLQASDLYARTITNFLMHLVKDGRPQIDLGDEMIRSTLLTYQGQIRDRS